MFSVLLSCVPSVHSLPNFQDLAHISYLLSPSLLLLSLSLWLISFFYFFTISGILGGSRDKHVYSICYIKLKVECLAVYPADSLPMETYSNVFTVINNANAPLYNVSEHLGKCYYMTNS